MFLIRILLLLIIKIYQLIFSSIMKPSCRFAPSCSEYAYEALIQHNLYVATKLIFLRIIKCHPWGESGFDPVPKQLKTTDN
ncbi:Putative membrane protein insertion efficiency factor [Rickettsiales bacterium Ac37b]|nr:Putative membrane protein insertion efficiency factor [Rickettsiales bacterium Ac37b]